MSIEGVTRAISAVRDDEIPVMIAGGGLVGLSAAMFLAQHGISSLAVERLRGGSPLPRAALFHMRTLEMYRSAGIEDDIIHQSKNEFVPEGALIGMDYISGKKIADFVPILNDGVDAISPSRRLFISQPGLEPILRRRAQGSRRAIARRLRGGGRSSRTPTASPSPPRIPTGGQEIKSAREISDRRRRRAQQGARASSTSRSTAAASSRTASPSISPPISRLGSGGKPLSVIYIKNPHLSGFFRMERHARRGFFVVNTIGDPAKDPEAAANAAADISEKRLIELVRLGLGVPDYPVKIDGVARWRATSDVRPPLSG